MLAVTAVARTLALVATLLFLGPASTGPAADEVRYSGSNGIELTYPSTWSRAAGGELPEAALGALALGKFDDTGAAAATFACIQFDPELASDKQLTAEKLARETVTAARAEGPQVVAVDVKPAQVGGQQAHYFELRRSRADGTPRMTTNWAVDWNGALFLISGTFGPGDQESRAEVARIVEGIHFSDDYRDDDGSRVAFVDRAGRIAMSHPAYWHDEPTNQKATLARWGMYDDQAVQVGFFNLTSDRMRPPVMTAQAMADALQRQFGESFGEVKVLHQRERDASNLSGHERAFEIKTPDGPRFAYCWISLKDGWVVVAQAMVLPQERARFEKYWDATVESITLK